VLPDFEDLSEFAHEECELSKLNSRIKQAVKKIELEDRQNIKKLAPIVTPKPLLHKL
jgi:hypothetical protein